MPIKTEGEMQVNCPNCGEKVTAENINIQKMTAVCAACDTVFLIDLSEAKDKAKRRKVKPPAKITLHDAETFHMEFWTNFRLDRNQAFLGSLWGGIGATEFTLLLIGEGIPIILPVVFVWVALASFYMLALTVVNKTHIEMDDGVIKVTRKPLPNPLDQGYEVSLAGVTAIKYEETAISKKEAYDTPRYRVWAETADGSRRTIVNDVIEDYAVFIAQHLEEHLQTDDDFDVSHLEERGHYHDDEVKVREDVRISRNNGRG
jgi:hypothetical protein